MNRNHLLIDTIHRVIPATRIASMMLIVAVFSGLFGIESVKGQGDTITDLADFPRLYGETSDDARFLRAVEAANRGLLIGRGTLEFVQPFVSPTGIKITLASSGATHGHAVNSGKLTLLAVGDNWHGKDLFTVGVQHCKITGVVFDAGGVARRCVTLENSNNASFEGCVFKNAVGDGVYSDAAAPLSFVDCFWRDCGRAGRFFGGNGIIFTRGKASHCGLGFDVGGADGDTEATTAGTTFRDMIIEQIDGCPIMARGIHSGIVLDLRWIEACGGPVWLNECNVMVLNCPRAHDQLRITGVNSYYMHAPIWAMNNQGGPTFEVGVEVDPTHWRGLKHIIDARLIPEGLGSIAPVIIPETDPGPATDADGFPLAP